MIMEKIKNDTLDILPSFWDDFVKDKKNRHLENELIFDQLNMLSITPVKFNNKTLLANIFDVFIFILKRTNKVFNQGVNDHIEILNIMCVYSTLLREISNLEFLRKNDCEIYLIEFIDIFSNFEEILHNPSNLENNLNFNDITKASIDKALKLYSKINKCI